MMKRLVCRIRGHQFGPESIAWITDDITGFDSKVRIRCCFRCSRHRWIP